jgi:hypothetical protein
MQETIHVLPHCIAKKFYLSVHPGNPTTQVRLFIIVSGLENVMSLPMAPICLRDVIIAWEKIIIRQVAE